MKITIIGNSVALRVRPPLPYPNNKNYTYLLKELLKSDKVLIENKAKTATITTDINQDLDQFISTFPDYFIINLGVVDATVREVPLWFYRLSTLKSDNIVAKSFKYFYWKIITKFRPTFARMRFKKPWVSKKRFRKEYEFLIHKLLKDTNAQVICLPINIGDDRIERILPGSVKCHKEYNQIIKEITNKYNVTLINLDEIISEIHYPDGVHYSAVGHEVVASKLKTVIKNHTKP